MEKTSKKRTSRYVRNEETYKSIRYIRFSRRTCNLFNPIIRGNQLFLDKENFFSSSIGSLKGAKIAILVRGGL